MTQAEFHAPQGRNRRWLSPTALRRRFAYLDAIDRRCEANSRRCFEQAAKVEFVVRDVDPATGEPAGAPHTVKSCTRHRRIYERAPDRYVVLRTTELPPGVPLSKAQRDAIIARSVETADDSTHDPDPGQG